ncbi:MAG: hypothetical protein O2949_11080 [Proteobacteria bacterium]|nr:hypothetical protein [Pseudomonadota bacterium]
MKATNSKQSPSVTQRESDRNPSIKASDLAVPVQVKTSTGQQKGTKSEVDVDYTPLLSVERAESDEQDLVAKTRPEYVLAFKAGVQKTARATLEMCRVVYEAYKCLDHYEFANFCREIGLKDWSSTVRKFIAIGKVYPRFIKYADQLPASWTSIYLITQIPADTFDECLKQRYPLVNLKGRELSELLASTKPIERLDSPLAYDKKSGGYLFGRVLFTKRIDDVDWRAMEKAFAEIEARLPIKIHVLPEMLKVVEQRRLKHYEATKQHHKGIELKPDLWDLGKEANEVYDKVKRTPVVQT